MLDAICKRERYSENDARKIVSDITGGLAYMHSKKVIHRDIKPENLILQSKSASSRVKIVDFGFSTVMNEILTLTPNFFVLHIWQFVLL